MYRLWFEGKPPVVNPTGRRYFKKDPFMRLSRTSTIYTNVGQDVNEISDRVRFR